MRAVAGIVVGLIVGLIAAVLVGIVALGATFSPPPGTDATNLREVTQVFMNVPPATLLALAAAWLAGGFVGALVAKLMARQAWAAWAVALVVAAYFGLNAFSLQLGMWTLALWIAAPLVGGFIANYLVRGQATSEVATTDEVPADI
jgi:hypothetical protein